MDDLALCFHVEVMVDAGLIDGEGRTYRVPSTGEWEPMIAYVRKPTWKGLEFLEAVRSDTVWNHVKQRAKEHGIPLLFDVAKTAALALAAQHIPGFPKV